jgi:hypothetical protein
MSLCEICFWGGGKDVNVIAKTIHHLLRKGILQVIFYSETLKYKRKK